MTDMVTVTVPEYVWAEVILAMNNHRIDEKEAGRAFNAHTTAKVAAELCRQIDGQTSEDYSQFGGMNVESIGRYKEGRN